MRFTLRRGIAGVLVLAFSVACFAADAAKPDKPKKEPPPAAKEDKAEGPQEPKQPLGRTMHIKQEITTGRGTITTEYDAEFLPPGKCRLDGRTVLAGMFLKTIIAYDGRWMKTLAHTPKGKRAGIVDVKRIQEVIPAYSPSRNFEPQTFKKLLDARPKRTNLGAMKLDGALTQGYEIPLAVGGPSRMPKGQPSHMRIWVNVGDGIPRQVQMVTLNGKILFRMLFTKVRTGVALKADRFKLDIPEGVVAVDMTEQMIEKLKKAQEATEKERGAETKK